MHVYDNSRTRDTGDQCKIPPYLINYKWKRAITPDAKLKIYQNWTSSVSYSKNYWVIYLWKICLTIKHNLQKMYDGWRNWLKNE